MSKIVQMDVGLITASEAYKLAKKNANVFVEKRLDEINKLIHEACENGLFEIMVPFESVNQAIVDKLVDKINRYKVTCIGDDIIINWEPDKEYHINPDPLDLVYSDYNIHDNVCLYLCPVCGKGYTDLYLSKYADVFECEKCGQPLYPLKGKE